MKAHRGVGVLFLSFLPSALDGDGWSVLHLGPLLQGMNPGTIGHEAGSAPEPFRTVFCRRENLFHRRDSNHGPSNPLLVAVPTEWKTVHIRTFN